MVGAPLGRVLLYCRDPEQSAAFYTRHFGFVAAADADGRIIELAHPQGGARIMLHRAAKAQKLGQVAVKLVFDVEDAAAFVRDAAEKGLAFGPVHQADGYGFANAKDPDGNSVSVSSRARR